MSPPAPASRHYLSPAQAARALGVSESTVKRWVDTQRLAACRTAGGHRRILADDILELVRREKLPHLDLAALRPECSAVPASTGDLADRLHAALRAGEPDEVRSLILEAGVSISTLADEVISPVMARIGHGWAVGELDVYREHRATQLCHAALSSLEARMTAANPVADDRPLALGGGPEGDHYLLANLLVGMALREAGWRVVNVGPNTPFRSLCRAASDLRPRLVWLSCSHLADPEAFVREYAEFYRHAERSGVAVAVGGRALTEEVRKRMTFTHFGDRIGHLTAYAGSSF
jgi:excisionase family DNA binding protein